MAQRGEALRLYRRILTLHKKKLAPHMRILGDQYVRDEFKRHKDAAPKFVPLFMKEWQQYEAFMSQKQDTFGKELSTEEKALLDDEQQEKLKSLKDAAKLVGETIAR
ncbi:Protein acn9 mitochondrial, partial [Globisporangium splendens]